MLSSKLIRRGWLAAMVSLVLSVCLVLVTAGAASARTELVEAYPANGSTLNKFPEQVQLPFNISVEVKFTPVGVYDLAAAKRTLSAAQGNTEATTNELTTQPAAQAEPDPEVLQRNTGGGNAPTWFLIVLGIVVIVVILAVRRLRR